MKIKLLHPNAKLPTLGSEHSAAYDIYMPEYGRLNTKETGHVYKLPLGIASEIPEGYAAILMPRSSAGIKKGISLTNTLGLIDSDYRGEWLAAIHGPFDTSGKHITWEAGDRLFQFYLVKTHTPKLIESSSLSTTLRDKGGLGSTGS